MDAAAILLALLVAGVNFGWQPVDDGSQGLEWIVQVEPELLDALQGGEAVPIESNVPPDVGPIRKVSIVVGRDQVPRQSLGAVRHTASFAGQGTWAPGQSNTAAPASSSLYDQYGTPPAVSASGVSPPPSVLERAQAAATETGTTLQEGIEAGIQAANQQLSRTSEQVLDSTRNAGQQVGQQLQNFGSNSAQQLDAAGNSLRNSAEQTYGAVSNQLQQASNPFTSSNSQPAAGASAQGGISPPPGYGASPNVGADLYGTAAAGQAANGVAASPGQSAPFRTPTGWTSIGSNVAAPPLIVPQLATSESRVSGTQTRMASNDGPGFPQAPTGQGAGGFSASSNQQSAQASDAAGTWAIGENMYGGNSLPTIGRDNAPTIGRDGNDSNLVSVQPIGGNPQQPQQAASQPADPWNGIDPWAQQRQTAATGAGIQNAAGNPDAARSGVAEWNFGSSPVQQNGGYQMGQPQTGNGASQATPSSGLAAGSQTPSDPAATSTSAAQPPWMPFVIVCLTLVGSLSANLFLGWSYLDARQRYRLLVRKTADTFRRVATPAA